MTTYPHSTDNLPYIIRDRETGEELAAADTVEGARLAADTLTAERDAPADWVERKPDPNMVTIIDDITVEDLDEAHAADPLGIPEEEHDVTAWDCDEPWDGPTYRERSCPICGPQRDLEMDPPRPCEECGRDVRWDESVQEYRHMAGPACALALAAHDSPEIINGCPVIREVNGCKIILHPNCGYMVYRSARLGIYKTLAGATRRAERHKEI